MSSPGKKTASLHESLPQGSRARSTLRENFHPRLVHGGPSSRGKRKTRRPFQEKAPLHLVLSSDRARGRWALSHRKNHARVQAMAYTFAARFKVKLHAVRVAGGRIHLLAKAADRKNLADFLRVLAGRVAVVVTGAKKGVKRIGKFWNELCWSKLLNWGRDFHEALHLIRKASSDSGMETIFTGIAPRPPPDQGSRSLDFAGTKKK
ncbi:MAG: hypothetical protein EBX52_12590 [Proteobacteria bacterium]|nr:hypothetical protein [Pseudomonadota bacterium]